MPYAVRTPSGAILSVHRDPVNGASPLLPTDTPELERFLGALAPSNFDRLDAEFVRVLEDLIATLEQRGLIDLADLPPSALAKLYRRQAMRHRTPPPAPAAPPPFADSGFAEVIDDSNFAALGDVDLGFAAAPAQRERRQPGR